MNTDIFTKFGIIPPGKKITFYVFLFVPLFYPLIIIFMKYNGILAQLFIPNDFHAYYYSSQLIFKDIAALYYDPGFLMPYRYFPLSPLLYFFYGLFPYDVSYIIGLFLIYFQSVIAFLLILKIAKDYFNHNDKEYVWLFYCIGLIILVPYIFILYVQIQTSITVMLTVLLSYYYFKKEENEFRNNLIGGIFITIAIMLKPTVLIVLPFLIDLRISKDQIQIKTSSFLRILPSFVMIFLNVIFFILYPSLLFGFIQNNFHYIYIFNVLSDSLTTFIARIFNIHPTIIFLIVCGILFSLLYYHFLTKRNDLIYYLALSILLSLISYIDIWNHSIIFLLPLILFIIMKTKSHEDKLKLKIIYYITIGLSWLNVFHFYFSVTFLPWYFSIFTIYYPIIFFYFYFNCRPSTFFVA